jgi:hypothetical protein
MYSLCFFLCTDYCRGDAVWKTELIVIVIVLVYGEGVCILTLPFGLLYDV